jgi:hypothetical protein
MSEIFGKDYASVYDALYNAQDNKGEVDLIEVEYILTDLNRGIIEGL